MSLDLLTDNVLIFTALVILIAAHVHVQRHTRKIIDMIADHRREQHEAEQRMRALLAEIRNVADPPPDRYDCQPPITITTWDGSDDIGFHLRRNA